MHIHTCTKERMESGKKLASSFGTYSEMIKNPSMSVKEQESHLFQFATNTTQQPLTFRTQAAIPHAPHAHAHIPCMMCTLMHGMAGGSGRVESEQHHLEAWSV